VTTERTITVKAADGTLTIAELRAFLEEFDAATPDSTAPGLKPSAANRVRPKARVTFGGHLKSLTVKVTG